MPRKKAEETTSEKQKQNFSKLFAKSEESVSTMSDEDFNQITEWIDTGSYSLNKLISGSIYKGIPNARIVALAGENSTGKSLMCGKIMKSAIEMGYDIFLFDTEGDVDDAFYERIGCDLDHVNVIEVNAENEVRSLETFKNFVTNKIINFKKKNPEFKPMIILDSFGGLSNEKEINDTLEGKTNSDMGQKQKAAKQLFRIIAPVLSSFKIPMVLTNHVYADTNNHGSKVMTGGEGLKYMASIVVFLSKSKLDEDKNLDAKSEVKRTGAKLRAECKKNRFVPPDMTTNLHLSYRTGLNKYFGLLEEALEMGEIVKTGAWFEVKHLGKKINGQKNLYNSTVFTKELLDKIDAHCLKKYSFADNIDGTEDAVDSQEDVADSETEE